MAPLGKDVSIPYWCDWKALKLEIKETKVMFQFLIGAIGRIGEFRIFTFNLRFNSLLVRLEGELQKFEKLKKMLFQFLIGAIGRTDKNLYTDHLLLEFQFLIGAIGRKNTPSVQIQRDSFNSLLVRLEAESFAINSVLLHTFQFLIGAIGSANRKQSKDMEFGFNSLLVRLEVTGSFISVSLLSVSIPYWCDWKCNQTRYL